MARRYSREVSSMNEDPLAPARGVIYGVIGGLALYALAYLISRAVIAVMF